MLKEVKLYGDSEPLPNQYAFHVAYQKYRCYAGGYGSGKTWCGCWECWSLLQQYPGTVGVVIRDTYRELKDSTASTFFKMLALITEQLTGTYGDEANPRTCPMVKKYRETNNELVIRTSDPRLDSLIKFRSADRPEKFKSLEVGFFWFDEGSMLKEEVFLFLVGRLRHPRQGDQTKGFITTNPCNERHWIAKRFLKGNGADPSKFFYNTSSTLDNPYLPEGYADDLRALYSPDLVKRYINGEIGLIYEGTPIYPEFDSLRHVCNVSYDPNFPVVRSWDFGFYNPACIIGQIKDSRLVILKELQGEKTLIDIFGQSVKEWCLDNFGNNVVYRDYCDPAGNQPGDKDPRTSVEILGSMGVHCQSCFQYILDGVEIIKMMLYQNDLDGKPRLLINSGCKCLIDGFLGGYHFPQKYTGEGEDPKPFKDGVYDHVQDCIRYMVWNTKFRSWLKRPEKQKVPSNTFDVWMKKGSKRGFSIRV